MDASLSLPLGEYVRKLVQAAGFEAYYKSVSSSDERDRYENIVEFVNAVAEFEKDNPSATAEEFLQSVSLVSDIDDDDGGERIVLATIHSVKGLEFNVVFIAGLEEDLFPSKRSVSEGGVQEERRVMYVAITRARQRLVITYAKSRFRFNEVVYSSPSRFVKELERCKSVDYQYDVKPSFGGRGFDGQSGYGGGYPKKYGGGGGERYVRPTEREFLNPDRAAIEKLAASGGGFMGDSAYLKPAEEGEQGLSLYKTGTRVFHKKFGEGTVIQVTGQGVETSASIAFKGLGVKKFNVALAPLKILDS
jgi:DNA helicase-2/ATP-dependent DNA helicase PcrA